ncbi:uncharacterized protein LOC123889532 [Trifolium pratense]|uniref:uncharacterized protein LOC123889532 n=1 Tax=Trifolium pratense TaxID=57577 RepID=UPI001E694D40|nr:uncharacterized protein LOC123889532 [Trifolium pratense]
MGNACFGKKGSNKGSVLHPLAVHRVCDQAVTIKVRMTRGELKDLMGKVDTRDDNSEIGRLILHECSKGRLQARIVATATDGDHDHSYKLSDGLRPIQEHGEEDLGSIN